jgi:UDP-N-acetylmuramoylalanine--D-glutamate ligase
MHRRSPPTPTGVPVVRPPVELPGKRVLVVGLGVSGRAAARLCHAHGAAVTLTDQKSDVQLGDALAALAPEMKRNLGGHRIEDFLASDLIVLSPGVPEGPELSAARNAGVAITGELELASQFIRATMIAITGTNGKSTTTTLCGGMMASTGRPTFVGGNLGLPLSDAVNTPAGKEGGVCVVEVSSFQAETIDTFRPQVAVLLNITPDHLDRYPDIDAYVAAKAQVFSAQKQSDFAVMNLDDPLVLEVARNVRSHFVPISTTQILSEGGWLQGETLNIRIPGCEIERYTADNPKLVGRHNLENTLAAIVTARLGGALPSEVHRGLLTFKPLPHRMELCAHADGVRYYNDSKGTNVGATVAALTGFPRPVVLIAGGRDKGGSYDLLVRAMAQVGRGIVLIGEAADRIEAAMGSTVPVDRASSMEEAVRMAASRAQQGDAVILSPACSSFDMFGNYGERGAAFRAAAAKLEAEAADAGSEPTTPRVVPKGGPS